MKTIYACQIAPEHQDSTHHLSSILEDPIWGNRIALRGNRNYSDHTPGAVQEVIQILENGYLYNDLHDLPGWEDAAGQQPGSLPGQLEEKVCEVVREHFRNIPEGRVPFTTEELLDLAQLTEEVVTNNTILRALEIVCGGFWECGIIQGCCQSDWQEVFYDSETWTDEMLRNLEAFYFNTGSEWIAAEPSEEKLTPEEIAEEGGAGVYCIEYMESKIKEEIKEYMGYKNDPAVQVVLYQFDGYIQTPKYKEV